MKKTLKKRFVCFSIGFIVAANTVMLKTFNIVKAEAVTAI